MQAPEVRAPGITPWYLPSVPWEGRGVSKDSLFIDKWGLAFFLHPTYPEKRCQENLQRDEPIKQRSGQQPLDRPGRGLRGQNQHAAVHGTSSCEDRGDGDQMMSLKATETSTHGPSERSTRDTMALI